MKKGGVLSIKKFSFYNFAIKDTVRLFLFSLLVFGLLFGVFTFSNKSNTFVFFKNIFNHLFFYGDLKNFTNYFIPNLSCFLFVDFIFLFFGVSIIGTIAIPSLIFIVGYVLGGLLSYSYFTYSIKGIAFNSVVIIPTFAVFLIFLVLTSRNLFDFSVLLSKIIIKKDNSNSISLEFSSLIKKYLILIVVTISLSALNALICRYILEFFDF